MKIILALPLCLALAAGESLRGRGLENGALVANWGRDGEECGAFSGGEQVMQGKATIIETPTEKKIKVCRGDWLVEPLPEEAQHFDIICFGGAAIGKLVVTPSGEAHYQCKI